MKHYCHATKSVLNRKSSAKKYGKKYKGGMYVIQHCFICRPSNSTESETVGFKPRSVATLSLTARHSNHLARSHPHG